MADTVEKMTPDEENALVIRAKGGDAEAFGILYDAHVTRIYRFALLKIGHPGDAEDLTHEVFLAAWRTMKSYESRGSVRLSSWLYRIAGNRIIDHYRTRKSNVSLDEMIAGGSLPVELATAASPGILQAIGQKMAMQEVMAAVRRLTGDQQDVIIMRYVEDLTPEETGDAMGKSAAAVRLIQHRALGKLKEMMHEHEAEHNGHEQEINRGTA